MSNKREREKRREERVAQETQVDTVDRRKRLLQLAAGAVFLVVVAVVVVIVANSASSGSGGDTNLEEVGRVDKLLGTIPQQGLVLGDPKAKVELIEFGDLQCPICKAYSEEILPQVIEGPIKQGDAKIDFRNFTIIGPESAPAGAAALAAGAQGRGWNYLDIFYKNQGKEGTTYANDEFLTSIAKGAGVKDIAKWNKEREGSEFTSEVTRTTAEAQRLGFTGTPSFAIKGPGTNGMELLSNLGDAEEIEEAIEQAS
jgi:protein-disulfide isomerase